MTSFTNFEAPASVPKKKNLDVEICLKFQVNLATDQVMSSTVIGISDQSVCKKGRFAKYSSEPFTNSNQFVNAHVLSFPRIQANDCFHSGTSKARTVSAHLAHFPTCFRFTHNERADFSFHFRSYFQRGLSGAIKNSNLYKRPAYTAILASCLKSSVRGCFHPGASTLVPLQVFIYHIRIL